MSGIIYMKGVWVAVGSSTDEDLRITGWWLWRLLSLVVWCHVVWCMVTNVLMEPIYQSMWVHISGNYNHNNLKFRMNCHGSLINWVSLYNLVNETPSLFCLLMLYVTSVCFLLLSTKFKKVVVQVLVCRSKIVWITWARECSFICSSSHTFQLPGALFLLQMTIFNIRKKKSWL